eukprot:CAMPEP_0204856608 /NCGR_PEP_ID=MMETSP1347-20130617/18808_1 /ASSEMBLY_ACC=CAM_ASM_000690 /TAXON_ID=215587 /ORGANISM="Aplanochytrium stocchinoi, Strain GSBS06" /LENGTH=78 /DNA_ID=CAMNT_0052003401 /DNA_START=276 /DNA_END=512 /DNA_ORIENTATION=+
MAFMLESCMPPPSGKVWETIQNHQIYRPTIHDSERPPGRMPLDLGFQGSANISTVTDPYAPVPISVFMKVVDEIPVDD